MRRELLKKQKTKTFRLVALYREVRAEYYTVQAKSRTEANRLIKSGLIDCNDAEICESERISIREDMSNADCS